MVQPALKSTVWQKKSQDGYFLGDRHLEIALQILALFRTDILLINTIFELLLRFYKVFQIQINLCFSQQSSYLVTWNIYIDTSCQKYDTFKNEA